MVIPIPAIARDNGEPTDFAKGARPVMVILIVLQLALGCCRLYILDIFGGVWTIVLGCFGIWAYAGDRGPHLSDLMFWGLLTFFCMWIFDLIMFLERVFKNHAPLFISSSQQEESPFKHNFASSILIAALLIDISVPVFAIIVYKERRSNLEAHHILYDDPSNVSGSHQQGGDSFTAFQGYTGNRDHRGVGIEHELTTDIYLLCCMKAGSLSGNSVRLVWIEDRVSSSFMASETSSSRAPHIQLRAAALHVALISLILYIAQSPWLEITSEEGIYAAPVDHVLFGGDEHLKAHTSGHSLPSGLTQRDRLDSLTKTYAAMVRAFDAVGLDVFLESSCLIGYVRHNGNPIPWDMDIDIGLLQEDCRRVFPNGNDEMYHKVSALLGPRYSVEKMGCDCGHRCEGDDGRMVGHVADKRTGFGVDIFSYATVTTEDLRPWQHDGRRWLQRVMDG
ncbi:glucosyltransferase [Perkinsus olseni]|uniref:Glucosyltransferase n=1 Tax=Perkinsus olseni TaxID=32597 RepID=A0A7J6S8Q8_PEROL|nr:glucosyltransferase [Perkinsus olseni]